MESKFGDRDDSFSLLVNNHLQNSGYWILYNKIITPRHGIARVVLNGQIDLHSCSKPSGSFLACLEQNPESLCDTANSYVMYPGNLLIFSSKTLLFSLLMLWLYWLLCYPLKIPSTLLPQGLCIYCVSA